LRKRHYIFTRLYFNSATSKLPVSRKKQQKKKKKEEEEKEERGKRKRLEMSREHGYSAVRAYRGRAAHT